MKSQPANSPPQQNRPFEPFCRPSAEPYSSEYVLGAAVRAAGQPRQTGSKSSIFLERGVCGLPLKTIFIFLILFSLSADPIDDLKRDVCDNIIDIGGWCSQEKLLHFIDLVLETKPEVCVEIGVYSGASVYPVASALQFLGKGIVIAIDPWDIVECIRHLDPDKNQEDLRWWIRQNMDHCYFQFLNVIRRFGFETICLPVRATSEKAARFIGPIDILYLDGNHYIQTVLQDIQLYLPKVRPGGYIWLNDTAGPAFDPAVQLLLETCDIVKTIDNGNCILFKRK